MRTIWRIAVFDILAPLAAIAGLLAVGVALAWPLWWVSVCSVLCLLIVQGVIVNFVLARRDSVTVGTDDDGPVLRMAVVATATAALVAAVVVGYYQWRVPDRARDADMAEVVRAASEVSEATASFSPRTPTASIDKAAALMVPERADNFRKAMGKTATELSAEQVNAEARTISAGIQWISTDAASVTVLMQSTRTRPNSPPERAVLALAVSLTKQPGTWKVLDLSPVDPGLVAPPPTSAPPSAAPAPPPR